MATDKLTRKQSVFVDEYLVDLNGAQAAIRAGYSAKTAKEAASENLTKPNIQAAIAARMAERAKKTGITQERVLIELARIAFFDPRKLLNPDGSPKPINELDDDTAAAVSGLEVTEEFDGNGPARRAIGFTKKFKIADKNAALTNAMRHLGMFLDKTEHSGTVAMPVLNVILSK